MSLRVGGARRRRALRLIAALVALLLLAVPAAAAAQCPQTSVADVEDEVMCPVCGTPLALAQDPPQAMREREFILELVEQCKSKEEIKAALVGEFGEAVLAVPDDEGFDLAAYLVPGLVVVLGAAAIAFAAVRWRRARPATAVDAAAAPNVNCDEAARLEAEESAAEDSSRLEADLRRYDL